MADNNVWVSGPCPCCGSLGTRQTYDIGSGPELSCAECEWCWGAEGQDLKPVSWTIDGEPVVVDDQDLVPGVSPAAPEREPERVAPRSDEGSGGADRPSPSLDEERAAVVARILEIETLPPNPDRQAEWRALNIRFSEIDKASEG